MASQWTIFLPALCLYPIWITIGLREDIFNAIATYYPMMLAMIVGSLIAGSTPLGGGVVAFPVAVLVLGFKPAQGRDFSLLIQSVGMTAASYLILYKKQHLVAGTGDYLAKMIIFSAIGLIIGFEAITVSPYIMNIVYTVTVVCVVLILMYQDYAKSKMEPAVGNTDTMLQDPTIDGGANQEDCSAQEKKLLSKWDIPLVLFALCGGLLTSQIGSGADIACYLFGQLVSAFKSQHIVGNGNYSDNSYTAMSVIVMASMSVFGAILRLTTTQNEAAQVSSKALLCLFSCVPIVILGAPMGSLFLTPAYQQRLKYVFYVMGILQLVVFGVIKIGNDVKSWVAIAATICVVLGSLLVHAKMVASKSPKSETGVGSVEKVLEEGETFDDNPPVDKELAENGQAVVGN